MNKNDLYDTLFKKYRKRKITVSSSEIKNLINRFYKQAKENYNSLPTPKLCSKKVYLSLWINQEITKDISTKSLKTVKTNSPPNDLKEAINFFQKENYHHISPNTDKSILVSASQDYIKVIKEKNIFAQNRGYKSYIDMRLDNGQISHTEYKLFLKNINLFALKSKKYYNKSIFPKSQLSNVCFVCQSKQLPYQDIDEFVKIFSKKYPLLKKHNKRIQVNLSDSSNFEYIKETDTFIININKNIKLNHQIIDFIHEISHINLMIKIFQKDSYIQPNSYILEKMAIKKEINLIKKYLPEILIPKIRYASMTICHTLFEIKLFNNPNQNPDILYSRLLNKFYIDKNIKENNGYLYNKDILFKNLSQLIYAIAYCNVFTKLFLQHRINN
jgi:hypothetical protein